MTPEPITNPPIFTLIMVSNFFAIAFGFIFKDMLEYQVSKWNLNRKTQAKIHYSSLQTIVAYSALSLCLFVFVAASLTVFVQVWWFAAIISAIVVLPTALLIWVQLGTMLELLVQGGSEAIDIDSYGAGAALDVQAVKPKPTE